MNKRIIVQNNDGSVSIITPTGEISIEEVLKKDVTKGLTAEIVGVDKIPIDRAFRGAWKFDQVKKVGFDVNKCKDIAHDRRRAARGLEFAPLDIKATIPAEAEAAETARVAVRGRYDAMQVSIDDCADEVALKALIDTEGI